MKSLIVIPTFNEAENILSILSRIRVATPNAEILVVDDNSPDGTADLVDGKVHLLRRADKGGLGPAYVAGFRWALEHDFDLIIEMDADGSHQPEELPNLISASERADLVIGSRWIAGGRVINWPFRRKILSWMGNLYVRVALGMKIKDATAGFRLYRREMLERIDLNSLTSNGYGFQIELAYAAHQLGAQIVEVPITFVERIFGKSKMNIKIVIEALLQTTKWALGRLPFLTTK